MAMGVTYAAGFVVYNDRAVPQRDGQPGRACYPSVCNASGVELVRLVSADGVRAHFGIAHDSSSWLPATALRVYRQQHTGAIPASGGCTEPGTAMVHLRTLYASSSAVPRWRGSATPQHAYSPIRMPAGTALRGHSVFCRCSP